MTARFVRRPGPCGCPSVIALRDYAAPARHPAFTRFNVFLRDRFACQYCGARLPPEDLTFDHVVPRSRGGRTGWTNVVAACGRCKPRQGQPAAPRFGYAAPEAACPAERLAPSRKTGAASRLNFLHESWSDFLYWDSELEQG